MRICKYDNCNKKLWSYGYCSQHGQRYKLYGNPDTIVREQHRMEKTPEYRSWCAMKGRCYNVNDPRYFRYGGRGITVAEDWRTSFTKFLSDMGVRPSIKHTLDRIDNNKGYSKDNCRWATNMEQCNNKENNRTVTYKGKAQTTRMWANELGLDYNRIRQRIFVYNWSVEKAFTAPKKGSK